MKRLALVPLLVCALGCPGEKKQDVATLPPPAPPVDTSTPVDLSKIKTSLPPVTPDSELRPRSLHLKPRDSDVSRRAGATACAEHCKVSLRLTNVQSSGGYVAAERRAEQLSEPRFSRIQCSSGSRDRRGARPRFERRQLGSSTIHLEVGGRHVGGSGRFDHHGFEQRLAAPARRYYPLRSGKGWA